MMDAALILSDRLADAARAALVLEQQTNPEAVRGPWVKVDYQDAQCNIVLQRQLRTTQRLLNATQCFECLYLPAGDAIALAVSYTRPVKAPARVYWWQLLHRWFVAPAVV